MALVLPVTTIPGQIAFFAFGVLSAWASASVLSVNLGASEWKWTLFGALVISATVFAPGFWRDLRNPSVYGCFFCWVIGVVGPWVLLGLSLVLSFVDAENLRMQGAILMLVALGLMVVRRALTSIINK